MATKRVSDKPVTISHAQDEYSRRILNRTVEAVNNNADELDIVKAQFPHLSLWGTFSQEATTAKASLSPSDFTVESGQPASIAGATKIIITIEGICGSAAGSVQNNKNITYTVTDSADHVISFVNDGNTSASTQVFKCMNDMDGTFFSSVETFVADPEHAAGSSGYAVFSRKVAGNQFDGSVFSNPVIKSFGINIGTNTTAYQKPTVFKVYAQFD